MATKQTFRRKFHIPAPPKVATEAIDYKNPTVLKNYISEIGKLMPGRIAHVTTKKQRKISMEVKRARFLALLPYTDKHNL